VQIGSTPKTIPMIIDVADHHLTRRSSTAWAKYGDADFVRPFQFDIFTFELFEPRAFVCGQACSRPGIALGLAHPSMCKKRMCGWLTQNRKIANGPMAFAFWRFGVRSASEPGSQHLCRARLGVMMCKKRMCGWLTQNRKIANEPMALAFWRFGVRSASGQVVAASVPRASGTDDVQEADVWLAHAEPPNRKSAYGFAFWRFGVRSGYGLTRTSRRASSRGRPTRLPACDRARRDR
jgi:hypothetical protein